MENNGKMNNLYHKISNLKIKCSFILMLLLLSDCSILKVAQAVHHKSNQNLGINA